MDGGRFSHDVFRSVSRTKNGPKSWPAPRCGWRCLSGMASRTGAAEAFTDAVLSKRRADDADPSGRRAVLYMAPRSRAAHNGGVPPVMKACSPCPRVEQSRIVHRPTLLLIAATILPAGCARGEVAASPPDADRTGAGTGVDTSTGTSTGTGLDTTTGTITGTNTLTSMSGAATQTDLGTATSSPCPCPKIGLTCSCSPTRTCTGTPTNSDTSTAAFPTDNQCDTATATYTSYVCWADFCQCGVGGWANCMPITAVPTETSTGISPGRSVPPGYGSSSTTSTASATQ